MGGSIRQTLPSPRPVRQICLAALGTLVDPASSASCQGSWIGGPQGRRPQRRDTRPAARTVSAMRVLGAWTEGSPNRLGGGRTPEGGVALVDRSRVGGRRACPAG